MVPADADFLSNRDSVVDRSFAILTDRALAHVMRRQPI